MVSLQARRASRSEEAETGIWGVLGTPVTREIQILRVVRNMIVRCTPLYNLLYISRYLNLSVL